MIEPNTPSLLFHFRNIGPVKEAELELGDLTIIAGKNNTGKTYLAYILYGFLKTLRNANTVRQALKPYKNPHLRKWNLDAIIRRILLRGVATFPANSNTLSEQRDDYLKVISQYFSDRGIQSIFNSQQDQFGDSQVEVRYLCNESDRIYKDNVTFDLDTTSSINISWESEQITISIDGYDSTSAPLRTQSEIATLYVRFLLSDVPPRPFILSSERFGISLFHRELDFAKNKVVEYLQNMGGGSNHDRPSPYLFISQATSRYALPIRDNIDYTRSIPDIRKDRSPMWSARLFDQIKNMVNGYYSATSGDIRFISKARKRARHFNIPLHLASSSARGLSDLYFFLLHVARHDHLLIVDEPESHLDTAHQIDLARMLALMVRSGLKVLITTHSDYIVKEINNLVMLAQDFEGREELLRNLRKRGYTSDHALDGASIRAYVAENGSLTQCNVDNFGIDMPVFDETIDSINSVANELGARIRQMEQE